MAKGQMVNDFILKPLLLGIRQVKPNKKFTPKELFLKIKENSVPIGEISEAEDFDVLVSQFLIGISAVLVDGHPRALMLNTKGWEKRNITEPDIEKVIRGPRDGFTETLRVNTTLIRRRIRDPNLRVITIQIGRRSKTEVALIYIQDVANPALVDEVKKRLEKIDIDVVMDSAYISHFIEDRWWSIFPTVQETERPDTVAASVAEGRVAILVDNSPFALIVPTNINMFMVSPEDAYLRWSAGSFLRLIRFGANFIALLLPGLYIALTSYHPEMLPTGLALSIAATRENVPFPAFVEAFLMELSLELLREAGARLPGPINQTIGIVGGLIVGTAAVQANIVSPIMVIIVALTAISAFAVPTFSFGVAIRQVRFLFMFLAAVLGIYGIMLGLLLLIGHLATLKSFGMGYLEPFAPLRTGDLRDVMIRFPLQSMHKRPQGLSPQDVKRLDDKG
ncbi:MAG: spore germination protein [Clostridia bacterium]|nr:spore germination protein [Clostridia bacterium]